ncbi:MAG: HlyD family efflux transporter periplasmic adaptor subunit [Dehalococcoidia bacterium]
MESLMDAFKALKLWQIGVMVALLAGTFGVTYGVYVLVNDSGGAGLAENQQLIPLQRGDLVNQVSTNGSLIYPNRETLSFGVQGRIGEVLVEEGQQVEIGLALVTLDTATVASLEMSVAQARVDLRDAEDALSQAQDPHSSLDFAKAEADVANAKLSLERAQESLDEIMAGTTKEEIVSAQSDVSSASVALDNALRDLSLTQKEWATRMDAAEDNVDATLEEYQTALEKWLGVDLSEEEVNLNLDPEALLSSWGTELATIFDLSMRFQDVSQGWFAEGPPPDDLNTPWNETIVYAWLNLYTGTIAVTCDNGTVPFQGVCIQKEIDDAWSFYHQAKDDLDTALTQEAKALANAEETVTKAEERLAEAQDALNDLLTVVNEGPDLLEVDVKEKELAVAQANLAEAKEDLAELQSSVDPLEVALWKAQVASAQTALADALERLGGSSLTAPMAGVVSLVNVEAGDNVNANTPVIEIVDPTVVEMDGIVDEIDILFVQLDAQALVTMDALQGQGLLGTVSEIASAATDQQGVVTYPIRIRLDLPQGVQLPEGLSATASIVIREENDVLLVPSQAIFGSFDQPMVSVMKDGSVEERAVVLGNSDGFWTVVQAGLVEGELVVMEVQQASTTQFGGFGGGFRQFQGGFPGGGFPGGGGGDFRRQQGGQN